MYCSCFWDDIFAVSMQITSQLYRWSERLREKYSVGFDIIYCQYFFSYRLFDVAWKERINKKTLKIY